MNKLTVTEYSHIKSVADNNLVHPFIRRRALILKELVKPSQTVETVAQHLGVSIATVKQLEKDFDSKRLDVLNPHKKLPYLVKPPVQTIGAVKLPARSLSRYITKHK